MTMELVEGRLLEQALAEGALSVIRFVDIAIALADALTAAHRKGIVHHRDVKPANVMVSDDGVVEVLDVVVARAMEEPDRPRGGVI